MLRPTIMFWKPAQWWGSIEVVSYPLPSLSSSATAGATNVTAATAANTLAMTLFITDPPISIRRSRTSLIKAMTPRRARCPDHKPMTRDEA